MPLRLPAKKASKYRNIRTEMDGITFDSKKEAHRWAELKLLEKAGEIYDLERQYPYPLLVTHHRGAEVHHVGVYNSDFRYRTSARNGLLVVEDVKSPATRRKEVYRLKKRIVEAIYGFRITEV